MFGFSEFLCIVYIWSRALESSMFRFASRWRCTHPCITEGKRLPQRCTCTHHLLRALPSPLADNLKSPENHLLVFPGDLEDLLDPLDPIENITCYTLENTLPQVTFTLQRLQNGLIVTSKITFLRSNPLKGFYSGDWHHEIQKHIEWKSSNSKRHGGVDSSAAENMAPSAFWNQADSEIGQNNWVACIAPLKKTP